MPKQCCDEEAHFWQDSTFQLDVSTLHSCRGELMLCFSSHSSSPCFDVEFWLGYNQFYLVSQLTFKFFRDQSSYWFYQKWREV